MNRLLLAPLLLLSFLPGCALFRDVVGDAIPRECRAIEKREPSWTEEREVGGTLALGISGRFGGFVIDARPDGGTPPDTSLNQLNRAVSEVGFTVASYSTRAAIPWTFVVVDNEGANAWSTPGGYVLVTRGLLAKLTSESQLAGVLAHEVAHTSLRHALHTYRTIKMGACTANKGISGSLGSVDPKLGGKRVIESDKSLGQLGTDLVMDKVIEPTIDAIISKALAQEDEFAADAMAVELLIMAGYDPREYAAFLSSLPKEKSAFPSHPKPTERTKRIEKLLAEQWKGFGWEQHPKVPLDPRITGALVTPKPAG